MSVSGRSVPPSLGPPAAGAERRQVVVPADKEGERLDRALSQLIPDLSRTLARKVIGMGSVYVGKQRVRVASRPVMARDVLTATWHPSVLKPARFPLDVLYADEDVVVVSKPAGQLVAGTELGDAGSLQLALERKFGTHIRLMHRLDMGASGLLLAALTKQASRYLTPQFREHTIERRYLAITSHAPAQGLCDQSLRKEKRRVVLAGDRPGMTARTHFKVLADEGELALVQATLETGRTHQIRVHLQSLGCSIVGDKLYEGLQSPRLCLHAALLAFTHPSSRKRMTFASPPAQEFFEKGGIPSDRCTPEVAPWLFTK